MPHIFNSQKRYDLPYNVFYKALAVQNVTLWKYWGKKGCKMISRKIKCIFEFNIKFRHLRNMLEFTTSRHYL